jgi:NitT/TauT family transport system substrate-binding protein
LALPESLPIERVGEMSLQRWQTLVSQMAELGLVAPEKVSAEACFTSQFL